MATTSQDLVANLCDRFPEDAEDLRDALEVLKQQRLTSSDRLSRLSDAQWQRLGLPLGIEALLRDELTAEAAAPTPSAVAAPVSSTTAAQGSASYPARQAVNSRAGQEARPGIPSGSAPSASAEDRRRAAVAASVGRHHAVQEEDDLEGEEEEEYEEDTLVNDDDDDGALPLEDFETEGLYRRGAGSGRRPAAPSSSSSGGGGRHRQSGPNPGGGVLGPLELKPPRDLEQIWRQLLEDTLPPDKREPLQRSWEATPGDYDRYMMFLEYSSYLRKPELTEAEKEARKKQQDTLMREFGLEGIDDEQGGWQGLTLWAVFVGMLLFVASTVYYAYSSLDPLHDLQSL